MEPGLRLRQRLREDPARLPPHVPGHRRHPRRPDARGGSRGRQRLRHPSIAAGPRAACHRTGRYIAGHSGPGREPGQRRHARRLRTVEVRPGLRVRREHLVDRRALRHACSRGAPGQPRLRGSGALRQAPAGSREACRPPDPAGRRDGGPWLRHLAGRRGVREPARRRDPACGGHRLCPVGGPGRASVGRGGVRTRAVPRAGAAGIAGVVLFAGYLLNGYQATVPAEAGIAKLTWFSWTAKHLPLAGQYDWASLLPVAVASVALLAVGVEAFARRDLGVLSAIRVPGPPSALLGLHGPIGRSFGDRLPSGLAWGLGLGVFGLIFAASSRSLADALPKMSPATQQVFHTVLPNFDLTTAGGLLQLVFVQLGFIVVGFAAASLVAGWASDETEGRLEMLLATPLARMPWAVNSAIGVYLAIAVMTLVLGAAIGIGALMAGSDALTPMAGTITLGLYAAAVAGLGFAIGGIVRTSVAAEIVAFVVTATFLIDLVAPPLKLPGWVHGLALTAHLGQPMVGVWDFAGIATCLVLAAVGLALGGWGMRRRDVAR